MIQVVTFLGWLSDPFKGLSDLQLGDEKGTLNHLGMVLLAGFFCMGNFEGAQKTPQEMPTRTLPSQGNARLY